MKVDSISIISHCKKNLICYNLESELKRRCSTLKEGELKYLIAIKYADDYFVIPNHISDVKSGLYKSLHNFADTLNTFTYLVEITKHNDRYTFFYVIKEVSPSEHSVTFCSMDDSDSDEPTQDIKQMDPNILDSLI